MEQKENKNVPQFLHRNAEWKPVPLSANFDFNKKELCNSTPYSFSLFFIDYGMRVKL